MNNPYDQELVNGRLANLNFRPAKPLNRALVLVLLFAIWFLPTVAPAQLAASSWPKTRGNPANTGISTSACAIGGQKWTAPLQGFLQSAPAVGADGNIYVGDDSGNFYSINGSTGDINWTFPVPATSNVGGNYVDTTPAIGADGTIYFCTFGGDLYALNPNGTQKGVFQTGSEIQVAPATGPDGTIYVATPNSLTAVDPTTMTQIWTQPYQGIEGTPAIGSDGTIYAQAGDMLLSIEPMHGTTTWNALLQIGNSELSSRYPPILTPTSVILTCEFDIVAVSISTHQMIWDFNSAMQAGGTALGYSPAMSPDLSVLYTDIGGTLYAINSATGALYWAKPVVVATSGNHDGVVIVGADGTIFDGVDDPALTAISPAGKVLGTASVYNNGNQETTVDMSMGIDGTIFLSPQGAGGIPSTIRAVSTFATLTFQPSTVLGGAGSSGTITLVQAQTKDTVFQLTAPNGSPITGLPLSVTVPAGMLSKTFNVGTIGVANATPATVSASYTQGTNSGTITGTLNVNPAVLSGLMVYLPTGSIVGGSGPVEGTVLLTGYAPSNGTVVQIISDNGAAVPPTAVTVPANTNSAIFWIQTLPVTLQTTANIKATLGTTSFSKPILILPAALESLSIPGPIVSGTTVTGNVLLSGPFTSGTWNIAIKAASGAPITISPATVMITAPSTSGSFKVTAGNVMSSTTFTVTATYLGASVTTSVTVVPIAVASITLNPANVFAQFTSTATVSINGKAPSGFKVNLASSATKVATVPASVPIPVGTTSTTFTVTSLAVTAASSSSISASAGGVTSSATLGVSPIAVSSVALSPASVVGLSTSTGTVTINSPAPTGGLKVTLASGSPSVATVPAYVTVQAGHNSMTFTVTTVAVSSNATSNISASAGGVTKSAALTVTPPVITSVTLSPASVKGPASSTGTVKIGSGAPKTGLLINLSSSLTSAATVPVSVSIPAGATSVTFKVTTFKQSKSSSATITASTVTGSKSGVLTVN